jgi:hypothetical protein
MKPVKLVNMSDYDRTVPLIEPIGGVSTIIFKARQVVEVPGLVLNDAYVRKLIAKKLIRPVVEKRSSVKFSPNPDNETKEAKPDDAEKPSTPSPESTLTFSEGGENEKSSKKKNKDK